MKERIKLIEKLILQVSKENIETIEGNTLMEAIGDTKQPCRGILRNVPISKYTENQNGRIYPRLIFEIIERKKLAEGNVALMGHPDEGDGSPKDIAGVWKNFKCQEQFPIADLYLTGEHGSHILEMIKAGGKIGLSSVGWGSFLEDEKTVDPNDYTLERCADLVLAPSQGVYASLENTDRDPEPEKKEIMSEIEKKDNISEKLITNKYTENITIPKQESTNIENIKEKKERFKNMEGLEKLYEANHKNQIKQLISEAKEMVDVDKAIKKLSDLTVVDADLKKDVEREIDSLQVKLAEQKKNTESNLKTKEAEVTELKAKIEDISKKLTESEAKYAKAKTIVESIGVKEDADPIKLKEEKIKLEEELKIAKENIKKMSADITAVENIFKSKNAKTIDVKNLKDIAGLCEDTIKRNKDLKFLYDSLKKAEDRIKVQEKILVKYGYMFEQESPIAPTVKKDDKDEMGEDIDVATDIVPDEDENVVMSEPGDEMAEDDEVINPDEDEMEEDIDVDTDTVPDQGETASLMTATSEPKHTGLSEDDEIEVGTDSVPEDGEVLVMDEEGEEDEFPVEVSPEDAEKMEAEDDAFMGGPDGDSWVNEEDEIPSAEDKMPWEEEDGIEDEEDEEKLPESEETEEDPKDKMAAVRAAKEESISRKREINIFVSREIKRNSALKDVEVALRKSNSLTEAMLKIDKFLSNKVKKDKPVKIKESVSVKKNVVQKPEIKKYVFSR